MAAHSLDAAVPAYILKHHVVAPLLGACNGVDVWIFALTGYSDDAHVVSGSERRRSARFGDQLHRQRWTTAHATLRRLLASYLAFPAAAIEFEREPTGKPTVAHPESHLHFNLSHSGPWGAVSIARNGPVGVDIEETRLVPDGLSVARKHFTEREQEWIVASDEPIRSERFLRVWTRKEALVKAIGKGLHSPLRHFDVGGPSPLTVGDLPGSENPEKRWRVLDLPPARGYVGAVANHLHVSELSSFSN
jgi:4'-phosphopantetheinyl transferase